MIAIKRIPTPTIDIIGPDGFIYKDLNDLTLMKLLIQIATNRLSGFWFYNDDDEKEYIDDLGQMTWPERFNQDMQLIYDLQNIYLTERIKEENDSNK